MPASIRCNWPDCGGAPSDQRAAAATAIAANFRALPVRRIFSGLFVWRGAVPRGVLLDAMSEVTPTDQLFEAQALPLLPDVARYALSLTRSRPDADDLVQDTFLMAFQQWHQFRPGTDCRAWLFTICRHRFYRTSQRAERQMPTEDPELEALAAAALHTTAANAGLEDAFERTSVQQAIEAAMDELPAPFREVAILVDLEDQSYEAASRILDVPLGTVRSRLFRARRMLQERLLMHAQDAALRVPSATQPPREPGQ